MPNVFSPNEDGVNDFFEVYESSGINSADIRIFNRWGMRVYNGTLEETPWDGTTHGTLCPAGVYFYWVDYVDVYGQTLTEKGSLTLIR
ncbi:MAG: gliding motility-associated C-terminal domain-containing protein, partial [Salibacteraceae bacterium]|nr:gliding motility-associated C-terminal domain-containing protein [Salibacteraceae bacterium]